jgi:hypothetical protein
MTFSQSSARIKMDIDFLYSKSGKKLAKSPQGINNYRLLFLSLLFPFSTAFLSQKHPTTQHQNSFKNNLCNIQLKLKTNSKRIPFWCNNCIRMVDLNSFGCPSCRGRLEYLGRRVDNASAHASAYTIPGCRIILNSYRVNLPWPTSPGPFLPYSR